MYIFLSNMIYRVSKMFTMLSESYHEWLPWLEWILCVYAVLSLLRKCWRRIRQHAKHEVAAEKLRKKKLKEAQQVNRRIESYTVPRRKTIGGTRADNKFSQSSLVNNNNHYNYSPQFTVENDLRKNLIEKENDTTGPGRGTYSVSKIANEYEQRSYKQRIHVASPQILKKRHTMSFFEGLIAPNAPKLEDPRQMSVVAISTPPPLSPIPTEPVFSSLVNGVQSLIADEEPAIIEPPAVIGNGHPDPRASLKSSIKETLTQMHTALSNSLSNLPKAKGNDSIVEHQLSNNNQLLENSSIPTTIHQFDVIKRPKKTHVETVEEILVEQRFSRSLSSYSITDLLLDQPLDSNIDQIIDQLH